MIAWIIVIMIILGILTFVLFNPTDDLNKAVRSAKAQHDISGVAKVIDKRHPSKRPTAYNQAIRSLWNSYDRDLALLLIKHLAQQHSDSNIAQYWLHHALNVEPQLARQKLEPSFLESTYRPEVAAKCGPVG